jgi:hypothetical protein
MHMELRRLQAQRPRKKRKPDVRSRYHDPKCKAALARRPQEQLRVRFRGRRDRFPWISKVLLLSGFGELLARRSAAKSCFRALSERKLGRKLGASLGSLKSFSSPAVTPYGVLAA